ncbi:MAG: ThiJ/PfpI protein [Clostridia bacterium]|nr:ThiJ/PfpI protein [Clostridia bacterium]
MDVNMILFDDFETLDVFGPVEIFGTMPNIYKLKYYSLNGGIIGNRHSVKIQTEQIDENISGDILLIPGGQGTRREINNKSLIDKITALSEKSEFCLTVCTGSALLAKTGLLKNRKATTNKNAFDWVKSIDTEVNWVAKARWVTDGKYYTSSGVSAGMDMTLGFIEDRHGRECAERCAGCIEYIWNSDKEKDLFAK